MKRKPKLGQNFLIDAAASGRIADALGDITNETVVEIGPGHGAITALLAPRAGRLICIELDRALAAELRFRFRNEANVTIVETDILSVDLASLQHDRQPLHVVGNLPYYITSDILLKLCDESGAIHTAVVMMQREVADRVAASPGTRDYGVLSVTVHRHAEVSSLFTLPPEAFAPPPDVYSTVLRLRMQQQDRELGIQDGAAFTHFVRAAFAQKRKTLLNNLRAAGYSAEQIGNACHAAGIQPDARAESIHLAQFATLQRVLQPVTLR